MLALSAACDPAAVDAFLERQGFVKLAQPAIDQPARVIFSNVWTRPELWARTPAP